MNGLLVGHYTLTQRPTGCTVVLAPKGAVAGVDVRGSAPGTRETDLLNPINTVQMVHGILLTGGSAFGLDAAGGVMRWLEEHNIGFDMRVVRVPIVPAAVIYDLGVGDPKIRPDADCGYKAATSASAGPVAEGNVGAGAGATVGKLFGGSRAMKGGVGTASITLPDGLTVSAIVVVNAVGDVIDPATGAVVAGVRGTDGHTLADARRLIRVGCDAPGGTEWREHHDRCGRDQRHADQGAGDQGCADGARRDGAGHLPVAHDGGRRHDLLPGDRRARRAGRRDDHRRPGRRHARRSDRAGGEGGDEHSGVSGGARPRRLPLGRTSSQHPPPA